MNRKNLMSSLSQWHKEYAMSVEHDLVITHVVKEGVLSQRFSFMVVMACSIAILGLLLSSPAVVIGAMLISPLMAPIMSLGFSLCILDLGQMKQALLSLAVGIVLAIGISVAIVSVSPLTEVTPEILARTQPNLFDLLVALFSGLAAGYAVIKRKGEAIVGVAIATALMPPLAVVGFGIATDSSEIYQGAAMLFMTNLLAIALTVTLLAKWYGFGCDHSPKHTVWQASLIFGVFTALSIPLGISLKNIAYQSYVTKTVKSQIRDAFEEDSKISLFDIHFSRQRLDIEAVILTSEYNANARVSLKSALAVTTGKKVDLKLDQIIIAKEKLSETLSVASITQDVLIAPKQNKQLRLSRDEEIGNALRQATFFPLRMVQVDAGNNQALIYPRNVKGLSLELLRQFEHTLDKRFPDWNIGLIPPPQALPYIYFPRGKSELLPESEENIKNILWALKKWEINEVTVIGYASSFREFKGFDNSSLAYKRATNVAEILKKAGIRSNARGNYHDLRQKKDELDFGINNFHRVEIHLPQTTLLSAAQPNMSKENDDSPSLLPEKKAASIVEEKESMALPDNAQNDSASNKSRQDEGMVNADVPSSGQETGTDVEPKKAGETGTMNEKATDADVPLAIEEVDAEPKKAEENGMEADKAAEAGVPVAGQGENVGKNQ